MHHTLNITTARLTAIHRRFGTITDISLLARLSVDELYDGPMLLPDDVTRLKWGLDNGAWEKWGDLVFARDGRKVLAFARQYADAYNNAWSEKIREGNEISFRIYVRWALRWIITADHATAKQKLYELAISEPDEQGWEYLKQWGVAKMIRNMEPNENEQKESIREMAKVFIEARDNPQPHLERLWLEMFESMGIGGAISWLQEFWEPASPEAKEAINAAYVAAKRKFTVETK
jgi:hypothetical protein